MSRTNRIARQLQQAIEAASIPLPGTEGEGTARTRVQVNGHALNIVVSFLNLNQTPGKPGRCTLILSAGRQDGQPATRQDGSALARVLGVPARIWTSGGRVCIRAA